MLYLLVWWKLESQVVGCYGWILSLFRKLFRSWISGERKQLGSRLDTRDRKLYIFTRLSNRTQNRSLKLNENCYFEWTENYKKSEFQIEHLVMHPNQKKTTFLWGGFWLTGKRSGEKKKAKQLFESWLYFCSSNANTSGQLCMSRALLFCMPVLVLIKDVPSFKTWQRATTYFNIKKKPPLK